jgi:trimeric autotransporter adhesin
LGTSNGQPLSVGIGGGNGLRIFPSSQAGEPVLISGSAANFVTGAATFSEGATISGGGSPLSNCGAANNLPCANSAAGRYSTIGGGLYNRTAGQSATVAGGSTNYASAFDATVGGGGVNSAAGTASTVAGGSINAASGTHSAIPGGRNNIASGASSFAAGNYASAVHDNAFVWNGRATVKSSGGDGTVQFASPSYIELDTRSSATSGAFLTVHGALSGGVVAMGSDTKGVDIYGPGALSFVSPTTRQTINLYGSQYGMGVQNDTLYQRSAKQFCWYVGGVHNDGACDPSQTGVAPGSGGGKIAMAMDDSTLSFYGSGSRALFVESYASGSLVTIPKTLVVGNNLFPPPSTDLESQFYWGLNVRRGLTVSGNARFSNDLRVDGTFTNNSDRSLKENIRAINPRTVLEKVAALPITLWNYKADESKRTHFGPMAQDFHRLFKLGKDNKTIANLDTTGVALAAIQGLNQVIKEKDAKIEALTTRLKAIEKKLGM